MAGRPSPLLLLGTQGVSAVGELFGQRVGRVVHKGSNLRMLVTVVLYSALQTFVVLALAELALPASITGGQGPLWLLSGPLARPVVWFNAFNNTIYWLALVYVLREPLGVVLVVLGFLSASLFVNPLQAVLGLSAHASLDPLAVVLSVLGTLLCVVELPAQTADRVRLFVVDQARPILAHAHANAHAHERARAHGPHADEDAAAIESDELPSSTGGRRRGEREREGGRVDETDVELAPLVPPPAAAGTGVSSEDDALGRLVEADRARGLEAGEVVPVEGVERNAAPARSTAGAVESTSGMVAASPMAEPSPSVAAAVPTHASSWVRGGGSSPWAQWAGLLGAFVVLAVTTDLGLVCITWMETHEGMNTFGFTAADQILVPVTTLPLVALLARSDTLAGWVGEPAGPRPRTLRATLAQTWQETELRSLIPFRGLMFVRELLFFVLATEYENLGSTYLQMTVMRVVLSWAVSVLACTRLQSWSGVRPEEAGVSLHPVNVGMKLLGSAVLVLAYGRLNEAS